MDDFRARIGDIGPSHAPNGRQRARYHYIASHPMRRYPFERRPGESLCNPNLVLEPAGALPDGVTEATCTKCLARADRYHVRIVAPGAETDDTPPAAAGGDH